MKKNLSFFVAAILFLACNNASQQSSNETKTDTVASNPAPPTVEMPFPATYSGDWTMGDPKYTKMVLDFYKGLEAGSIDAFKDYFADTLTFRRYDNVMISAHRDEMYKRAKEFRKKFTTLKEEFLAYVSLHSNDRNEDWVCLWIVERGVMPNGKTDSTAYQENWRFRNGKVYALGNYARYGFK